MKMERIQCTEHDGISFTNDYKLEVWVIGNNVFLEVLCLKVYGLRLFLGDWTCKYSPSGGDGAGKGRSQPE